MTSRFALLCLATSANIAAGAYLVASSHPNVHRAGPSTPRLLPTRAPSNATTNVPLTDWTSHGADLQWFGTVSVGTPAQNFTVIFDTGSPLLLLPNASCTTCDSHARFDPSASSTFVDLHANDSISFATGADTVPLMSDASVLGADGSDTVVLGDWVQTNHALLLASSYADALDHMPIDGIMGLAPSLGITLGFDLNIGNASLGALTMFGTDPARFVGEVTYVDLLAVSDYWSVAQAGLTIDGAPAAVPAHDAAAVAILDTGTAYIQTPDNATTAALYAQISGKITRIDPAGAWGAACDVMAGLDPVITFTFGNASTGLVVNMTVSAGSFNLGEYPGQPGVCQGVFVDSVFDFGDNVWIVGSPLLKANYTVWDGKNGKFGVAKLKRNVATGSSTL